MINFSEAAKILQDTIKDKVSAIVPMDLQVKGLHFYKKTLCTRQK